MTNRTAGPIPADMAALLDQATDPDNINRRDAYQALHLATQAAGVCHCGESMALHIGDRMCTPGVRHRRTALHHLPVFGAMWAADGRDLRS